MSRTGDDWLEVGVVGKPHGVRGQVHVRMHNTETELIAPGRLLATIRETGRKEWVVSDSRRTPKDWLVGFEGVDQREAAAALTNETLYVQRAQFPPAAEDEVYQCDLVGLRVETREGETVGRILGFFNNGAHEVCVVEREGKELLLPFVTEVFVDADLEAERVILDLPEGFLET
jgi:16S rRNA processing protein RimM